jgi:hypothetical protein
MILRYLFYSSFVFFFFFFLQLFFSLLATSDASTVCRIFGQRVGGHFRFVYIDCTVFQCYLIFHVHCGPYYTFRRNSFTDFRSILLPALYGFFDDFIHGFTTCYLRIFFTFSTALFTDLKPVFYGFSLRVFFTDFLYGMFTGPFYGFWTRYSRFFFHGFKKSVRHGFLVCSGSCAAGAGGGLGVSSRALFVADLLDRELDPGGVEAFPSWLKMA